MPKVSVIVPVYKVEKYIEKCVRSLFGQTLDEIEYIFVNDCTPDASMEVLQNVLEEYPVRKSQVKILNHTVNTGQSGARRDGMRMATGDFIIHCDADDWVELDMYEKMYRKAVDDGADAVCCDMVMEEKDSQKHLIYNNLFSDDKLMYACVAPISVVYCSMCNRLISRKIYDQYSIEPFPGVNMWDDVGLSIRFRYYIRKSVVINESLYHYNRQNDNSTTRRPVLSRIQEQIECAKKLELFFTEENESKRYGKFISLVKQVAKIDLFYVDLDLWRNTFPETRKDIGILKQCSKWMRVKMQIVAYGGVSLYKAGLTLRNRIL